MNGRHSVAPPADAWAHARDPRFNAPPTISRLHGDARTRVLAARADSSRRRHLASYAEVRSTAPAAQPFAWARSFERAVVPMAVTLAALLVIVAIVSQLAVL